MNTNSNADILDTRDIIARIEELREERDDHNHDDDGNTRGANNWVTDCADEADELATLEALMSELADNSGDEEWEGTWYPVTLIRDSYFETAMDELLEDIGDMPAFDKIPSYLKITVDVDYDALQMDYTSVDYDGVTYWYR